MNKELKEAVLRAKENNVDYLEVVEFAYQEGRHGVVDAFVHGLFIGAIVAHIVMLAFVLLSTPY